jgi:hypothetical protein
MDVDRNRVFEQLQPPPGGAERLARRFGTTARPSARVLIPPLAAAGIVAVMVLALYVGSRPASEAPQRNTALSVSDGTERAQETERLGVAQPGSLFDAPEFDRLLGRAAASVELSVDIDGRQARVEQREGSDPRIRVYLLDAPRRNRR